MICSIYNQQPKQNSSLLSYHDSEEGQVQVQLAFASLYLDLAFVDLSGVGGGPPRATPAEVVQVNLKDFNLTSTTSARVGEVHGLRYCAIYIRILSVRRLQSCKATISENISAKLCPFRWDAQKLP